MAEQTSTFTGSRSTDPGTDIPLDDVFDALADEHRRRVLRCLRECDPPVEVGTVARMLEERVGRGAAEHPLETGLHHRTLPKLDAVDIIDYEPASNLVLACRTEATEPYLDAVERLER